MSLLDGPRYDTTVSVRCSRCWQPYLDVPQRFYGPHGERLCPLCRPQDRVLSPLTVQKGHTVATVNFCERKGCQTMGKSTAMGALTYMLAEGLSVQRVEICPGCVAEFAEWLEAAPTGERPRAYQDPYTRTPPPSDVDSLSGDELMRMAMRKMRTELEA